MAPLHCLPPSRWPPVTAAHKKRRRRVEFLDFMNDIVAAWPDTAIHVVLDNLNTHKPSNDRWLKLHPNVQFHFTPSLDQVQGPSKASQSPFCGSMIPGTRRPGRLLYKLGRAPGGEGRGGGPVARYFGVGATGGPGKIVFLTPGASR